MHEGTADADTLVARYDAEWPEREPGMAPANACASAYDVADHAIVDVLDNERQTRDPVRRPPQRRQEYDLGRYTSDGGRLRERTTVHTLHVSRVGRKLAADQHAVEYARHHSGRVTQPDYH